MWEMISVCVKVIYRVALRGRTTSCSWFPMSCTGTVIRRNMFPRNYLQNLESVKACHFVHGLVLLFGVCCFDQARITSTPTLSSLLKEYMTMASSSRHENSAFCINLKKAKTEKGQISLVRVYRRRFFAP